jgi:hypothetical protein
MFRKKAAKARELSLIYKEEAEQLEHQASELERTLQPIYPKRDRREPDRYEDRPGGYDRRDDRARDYDRRDDW